MRKSAFIISLVIILSALMPCMSASAFTPSDFEVTASSALLVNADSGDIIFSKNAEGRGYAGAVSNLMVALVVCDEIADLDSTLITVQRETLNHFLGSGAAMSNLSSGQVCSARTLMQFLLVSSGVDAALILAEYIGGGDAQIFVDKMNQKAKALGMNDTNYTIPYGLYDEQQYTTAEDTMKLLRAAFKNDEILAISSMSRFTAEANDLYGAHPVVTTNYLINNVSEYYYRYAVAGKTGYTDAGGRCVAALAERDGISYYCVILGGSGEGRADLRETTKLFKWAFSEFDFKTVVEKNEPIVGVDAAGNTIGGVEVGFSWQTDYMQLYAGDTVVALMPSDADRSSIMFEIELAKDTYNAPIKAGDVLGRANIMYSGEKVGEVDLVAMDDADYSLALHIISGFKWFFTNPVTLLLLAVVAAAIIALIIIIILSNRRRRRKNKLRMYKRL